MTTPTDGPQELPADAPEADYVEQHQAVVPGDADEATPAVVDTDVDANPADVLEQAMPVPVDDEDDDRA
jgi:hypothetical protein